MPQPEAAGTDPSLPLMHALTPGLLEQHPGTHRHLAYTYGVLETGVPPPESDEWQGQVRSYVEELTQDPARLTHYARMIVGLALGEHRRYVAERTDVLTGLPNRRGWIDDLRDADRWVAGRPQPALYGPDGELLMPAEGERGVVVGLLDVSNFKPINDLLGHKVGDRVLEFLGRRFLEVMRRGEPGRRVGQQPRQRSEIDEKVNPYPDWGTVSRIGGDEIAFTLRVHGRVEPSGRRGSVSGLEEVSKGAVSRLMSNVEMAFDGPEGVNALLAEICLERGRPPMRVGQACGWAFGDGSEEIAILVDDSDAAMYEAKRRESRKETVPARLRLGNERLATMREVYQMLIDPTLDLGQYNRIAQSLGELLGLTPVDKS